MYRFRLFGRFEADYQENALAGLESKKVQELFCFLATFRKRAHTRELVAELLWEGYPVASTKKNMRQTLWQLQSALNSVKADAPVIVVDGDFLAYNTIADAQLDIDVFEHACKTIQDLRGSALTAAHAALLEEAVTLYRADFLEGWYIDWCLHERERYHNLFLMTLDKLITYYASQQEFEAAIHFCNRALREDYNRECTHYELIRLFYLRGDRTAALRQYRLCCDSLIETLGIEPGRRIADLYGHICADNREAVLNHMPIKPDKLQDLVPGGSTLPEMLTRLTEVKMLLEQMESQVQQSLRGNTPG